MSNLKFSLAVYYFEKLIKRNLYFLATVARSTNRKAQVGEVKSCKFKTVKLTAQTVVVT